MTNASRLPRAAWALAALLVAVYAAGLGGPFVLDDHVNLLPVWQWWAGQAELSQVFANPSGPLGRPLAMLSFAANAAVGGQSGFGFKLVNLLLHLANSALVFAILRRLLPGTGAGVALLAAAAWALHPQHVSTVLYSVQRMALLGALAQFGAVWIYLEARASWDARPDYARRLLFAAFPAVVVVGALGKESALLAPLLCAALEYGLPRAAPLPRMAKSFFALTVALPLLAAVVAMFAMPDYVLRGYAHREFDLSMRLMSEGRALFDYAANWFYPSLERLSLYRDGFPLSTGWLAPPTTAMSAAALAVLATAALALRSRLAPLGAGVLWFLAAHVLESTVYPLEIYFEHRNYVASFGLVLTVLGVARALPRPTPMIGRVAAFTLLLVLSAVTALRAWQWGDFDRLLASESPPAGELSRRLQVDRAIRGFENGDAEASAAALAALAQGNRGDRAAAALWTAILQCDRERALAPATMPALREAPPAILTHSHVSWLGLLVARRERAACTGVDAGELAALIDDWSARADRPPSPYNRARLDGLRRRLEATP